MATPLGIDFSIVENQVSQCDEQTFGSISEFKEAGVARAPLAKSSKQVSVETDEALCEPTAALWRNKEAGPQNKDQNLQTVTFENLVVHFDQGKLKNSSLGVAQCSMHGSIERSPWPRFRNRNRKQNPSNTSQPRVWLVRFPANLSLLFQSRYGGQSRRLCMKPQA